ncbi:GNAT family N-acetyltransferase [Variovorax paradoxus]|uniref:GNAT family N-acetyltransferase n=1 Tax=Variovorax paradoxus TaxID=34073 RepID=UPI0007848433|nr:GNAT family N-acetyltransferase [Variovorax paradoxus]
MNIQQAHTSDAEEIAAVLQEAAQWLSDGGRALWSGAEIGRERVLRDTSAGLFHVAREGGQLAGVMKFELEDPIFWPEIAPGTSAFVHKLAVRRAWAKKGISTELLSFARGHARALGRSYLRLDCVADRPGLRNLYEHFGFALHSVIRKGTVSFARYELRTTK